MDTELYKKLFDEYLYSICPHCKKKIRMDNSHRFKKHKLNSGLLCVYSNVRVQGKGIRCREDRIKLIGK